MLNITRRNEGTRDAARREWDPFRMMEQMLRADPFRGEQDFDMSAPCFDVKETGDAFVFSGDLPGVAEKDVEISLTGNRLLVSGKREMEKREEKENWYAYERSYGTFRRAFTLPEGIDADHVDAQLKDGVLTIHVAKKPEIQSKRIELNKADH